MPSAEAANRTWVGLGGDDEWTTPLNWSGGTPNNTGDVLFFGGTNRLTSSNVSVTNLSGITFTTNAGSFTLTGNAFTLSGSITNLSGVLQTIENNMTLNANRSIETINGNITLKGTLGQSGGTRILYKYGTGTLTLAGATTFTGDFYVARGTAVLDAGSGGSLAAGGLVGFGYAGLTNQGGTFKVLGATSGTTTVDIERQLYLGGGSGANRLVVDANGGDGTTLSFSNYNRLANPTNSNPTLHIDLSSPGSALKFEALGPGAGFTYGTFRYASVTDGTKTGFATRDTNTGFVTRLTNTVALPVSGGSGSLNYHTANITITNNVSASSLTINGGSEMSQTGTRNLSTTAILMEEGVGDYNINIASISNNETMFVHQYSTNGTLTFSADIIGYGGNYNNFAFVKTGPGKVVFNGSAINRASAMEVQQGVLEMNGNMTEATTVQVRDGATLAGSGDIGGGIKWQYSGGSNSNAGTRYTPVNVWSGGTLDATPDGADALKIAGTLTFQAPDTTFKMNLAGTNLGALMVTNTDGAGTIVTLDGDLQLTLGYTPTLGDEINLLTWTNGTSSGAFASVNGILGATNVSFAGGYDFDVHYDSDRVWLKNTAIPEPAALTLLLTATTLLLPRRRPRGQSHNS